ncbi:Chloroplast protein FOR GROWTH AND FERTILITY 2 [Linum perenne]
MHPIFASPALATFQTAANTGAPGAGVGTKLIRTELLSSAWTGFFAGCLHTLSGPDHLAALAPLSIGRSRLESAAVGALWGCGHDAGQVIFGLLFLLLKDRLHIEILRTWGTRVVGITLLVIGGMGIKEASEVPTPCVALENGECDVSVYESAALDSSSPAVVGKKKKIGFATFATGIVHGLQPDALMMVLPALALPSRVAGAAFLVMFLVGTVIAMGCYTVFIGSCSEALKDRVPRITEKLTWASSLIAITLGVAILISQFFGFSLY